MEKPTADEVTEWVNSPTSKWYFSKVKEHKDFLVEALVGGGTMNPEAGTTAQLTARIIGEIAGLDFTLERKFVDSDED